MLELKIFNRKGQSFTVLFDEEDRALIESRKWYIGPAESGLFYVLGFDPSQKTVRLHRVIFGSRCNGQFIDHINGNGLDNRKENLRITDKYGNARNRRVQNGQKYKGVIFDKSRPGWRARIQISPRPNRIYLQKRFGQDQDAAARWYDEQAKKYFGEHAWLNFPEK